MRVFDVLNESNVELRKSESTFLSRRENENVSNICQNAAYAPNSTAISLDKPHFNVEVPESKTTAGFSSE